MKKTKNLKNGLLAIYLFNTSVINCTKVYGSVLKKRLQFSPDVLFREKQSKLIYNFPETIFGWFLHLKGLLLLIGWQMFHQTSDVRETLLTRVNETREPLSQKRQKMRNVCSSNGQASLGSLQSSQWLVIHSVSHRPLPFS